MTSNKVQSLRTGVFIDGSNLFWAMNMRDKKTGDKLHFYISFEKLKDYLNEKFSPVFYNYYGVEDKNPTKEPHISRANGTKKFHDKLSGLGYNVIRKDLKYIGADSTKGDTDSEVQLDMHKLVNDYDNIVLFSGDSDFFAPISYFHSIGKFIRIYSFEETLSWELKDFAIKNTRCNYKLLDELRSEIEYIQS